MSVRDRLPLRLDVDAPVPSAAALGRVHVLAVGGAGMSAVARLLLDAGLTVSGSDAKDGPVLEELRTRGATIDVGHAAEHVEGVDTVVVSSAIRDDNPELVAARAAGVRVLHRSQGLAATMGEQRRVAVAGANGKTTTSSMLTSALLHLGARPSFALGGELAEQGTNAALGDGPDFVAEADESDGSFLVYHPDVAVITNVQPDHLDFYGDYATVQEAYAEFARTVRPGGLVVTCADDEGSARLAARLRAGEGGEVAPAGTSRVRVVTYGFGEDADVRLGEPVLEGHGGRATLTVDGATHELRVRVPGRHNLLNAAAAFAAATLGCGHDADAVLAGLAAFGGTRRRFEVRGEVDGVTVVDDYAHNPGKVTAVVATASEIARPGRLLVIFQPHLYSRTSDFAQEFAAGLAPADDITLLEIYGAREDPVPGVTSEIVAAPLRAAGRAVQVLAPQEAVAHVVAEARPGDLVMTVGAGDVTALTGQIVTGLTRR